MVEWLIVNFWRPLKSLIFKGEKKGFHAAAAVLWRLSSEPDVCVDVCVVAPVGCLHVCVLSYDKLTLADNAYSLKTTLFNTS